MKKADEEILKKIKEYATDIAIFSQDITFEMFENTKTIHRSTVFTVGLIGEMANKLSPEFCVINHHIPFKKL